MALSAGFSALLAAAGIPAALLLGPMAASILLACAGLRLSVSAGPFSLAQGVIGCMIAGTLGGSFSGGFSGNWPLFAAGVLSVVAASWILGLVVTRLGLFPGRTAVWGISPGAATVMTILAEESGADAQLVAFMQYARVLVVAALASGIATFFGGAHAVAGGGRPWLVPEDAGAFLTGLALVACGPLAARFTSFPGAALVAPMLGGIVLSVSGITRFELPGAVLAAGYALVGWRIGLRFSRPLLRHVARQIPQIAVCTLLLVAVCAGIGMLLTLLAGVDPLTAYLATSPGGADSVAIIAASAHVDQPFVMTMQMTRFLAVVLLEPLFARHVAGRTARKSR